jgi:adenine-specific DNA-methyltransferase
VARKASTPKGPTPVETITHGDKRANIPTADAHDLVDPQIENVRQVRYPRDPSLDPQLVWRDKDEQDSSDLVTDAPPIYIQEKINPQVLIENLRKTARPGELEPELTLFDTFDGLSELDLVDFYQHRANWSNRMILGDSQQVMASLAERELLRGKVQMIYIDPPYGIKFGSNWQVSTRKRDVKDGKRRGRRSRGGTDQSLPRHVGARHPLLPFIFARPPGRRPRPSHRERQRIRPDRLRKCAPCAQSAR